MKKLSNIKVSVTVEEPERKRFSPTILMIHHWGGSKRTVRNHAHFVRILGYKTVSISLDTHILKSWFRYGLPVKYFVAAQIGNVLQQIEGPIIIYSFSSLGAAAFTAITQSYLSVKGFICDGGPFAHFYTCSQKLMERWYGIPWGISHISALLGVLLWDPSYGASIKSELAVLPQGFPVLSIRGELDPLVTPAAIDAYFAHGPHLQIERFHLSQGLHLDGLKRFPDLYKDRVQFFLQYVSTL